MEILAEIRNRGGEIAIDAKLRKLERSGIDRGCHFHSDQNEEELNENRRMIMRLKRIESSRKGERIEEAVGSCINRSETEGEVLWIWKFCSGRGERTLRYFAVAHRSVV